MLYYNEDRKDGGNGFTNTYYVGRGNKMALYCSCNFQASQK